MSFTNKSIIYNFVDRAIFILIMLLMVICFGCQKKIKNDVKEVLVTPKDGSVIIVTNTMDFVVADSLKAGWHTFKYENRSNETHFFVLDKYSHLSDIPKGLPPYHTYFFHKAASLIYSTCS